MLAEYTLLSIVFGIYGFAVMICLFIVFGWCDPAERERKIAFDIFSGVMTIIAIRSLSQLIEITETHVQDPAHQKDIGKSILDIVQNFYNNMNLEDTLSQYQNELLGLIIFGITTVFQFAVYFISIPLSICFIFRMASLLDIYINNTVRYIIMIGALIFSIILGAQTGQTGYMWLTVLIGTLSILRLAIGHYMLITSGQNGTVGSPSNQKTSFSETKNAVKNLFNKGDSNGNANQNQNNPKIK